MSDADPDWSVHLLQLAARGELGRATPRLLLDLPALAQPWTCASAVCTPGLRAPDARSCCADLEVTPTAPERAAIHGAMDEIAAFMAPRDARWADGPPEVFAHDALRRPPDRRADRSAEAPAPGKTRPRCVFALHTPQGLACGLHAVEDATSRPRGTLKPLPCRLFPLILVDIEDGRTLLSAIHPRTARLAGSRPARAFPCLGIPEAATVAESCADTLTELFGARAARSAGSAAATWRRTVER